MCHVAYYATSQQYTRYNEDIKDVPSSKRYIVPSIYVHQYVHVRVDKTMLIFLQNFETNFRYSEVSSH